MKAFAFLAVLFAVVLPAQAEEKKVCFSVEALCLDATPKKPDATAQAKESCEKGGGTWDAAKPAPKSQLEEDLRCDLATKNEGKGDEFARVAFCNDPDDKSSVRQVYAEYKCSAWRVVRRERARTEAKVAKAVAGLQPTDLKPLEAKVGETEVEAARIAGELKTVSGALEALEGRTEALEAAVKAHGEQLAPVPACEEFRKAAAEGKQAEFFATEEGRKTFQTCLDNEKTDPVAREAIRRAGDAFLLAKLALTTAKEAKESAARAVHLGVAYSFGFALQPALSKGTVTQRGGNSVAPLGVAFLLHAERLHLDIVLQLPVIEQMKNDKGVVASTYGIGGNARVSYVWTPEGWSDWVRVGPAVGFYLQGTDFLQVAPNARAFAMGVGLGGRAEFGPADSAFRLIVDADALGWDWVSGSIGAARVTSNGYAFRAGFKLAAVF